jgi:hypothetical protein
LAAGEMYWWMLKKKAAKSSLNLNNLAALTEYK